MSDQLSDADLVAIGANVAVEGLAAEIEQLRQERDRLLVLVYFGYRERIESVRQKLAGEEWADVKSCLDDAMSRGRALVEGKRDE